MAEQKSNNSEKKINRRDLLKGFATVPVLGLFAYDFYKTKTLSKLKNKAVNFNLGLSNKSAQPNSTTKQSRELLRIGVIGVGHRAVGLIRALGFASMEWYEELNKKAKQSNKSAKKKLDTFFSQELLNVQIVGICDVFDLRANKGVKIASKGMQPNGKRADIPAKRYLRYQDLLEDKTIDAVIIATPDFHHAPIIIDSIKAGKHVYCEKTMVLNEKELNDVYHTVGNSNRVFQLGHQLSKSQSYKKAREIVNKNILGKVTLVEVTTNRNTKHGAWYRHLDSNGNPKPSSLKTIDWEQWLGNTPKVPFSIDRYYGYSSRTNGS